METLPRPTQSGRPEAAREQPRAASLLDARPGGIAERLARSARLRSLHPAAVFFVVMLAGLVVIALVSTLCGLAVRELEHVSAIGAPDERVDVWLAAHRTADRTRASLVGSTIGGGVVLPIVAGSIALVCCCLRKWRIAAFVVFVLAVESATYRITTLLVHSHRPRVVRLEHLPVNASYPSGHTAASLAVYGGLALLLTYRFTSRTVQVLAWTLALGLVSFVAVSRMYRGMHHPLDVAGGLVVGVLAIVVVTFACRTAGAVAEARR
ncbi:MAG TPA: phosphatase PAP2 family protein [Gaiellaceae bacterium]